MARIEYPAVLFIFAPHLSGYNQSHRLNAQHCSDIAVLFHAIEITNLFYANLNDVIAIL